MYNVQSTGYTGADTVFMYRWQRYRSIRNVKQVISRSLSGYYAFNGCMLCIMKHGTSILLKPVKRDKIMQLRAAPGAER